MEHFIVITTINPPTAALMAFADLPGWHTIVVGDRRSVPIPDSESLTFLSLDDQQKLDLPITRHLPTDHYARKNIGYLFAMKSGARVILDTDDDNIPLPGWSAPDFVCDYRLYGDTPAVNVYEYFSEAAIWPRGFPLEDIRSAAELGTEETDEVRIGVWQSVVDGDPDVDAIYRLIFGTDDRIEFLDKPRVYIPKDTFCPFNSQATVWHRDAFLEMFLPLTVSFRYTDILRSYVAQPILWGRDMHLGFCKSGIYQERNAHDFMEDFRDEYPMYSSVKEVVNMLNDMRANGKHIELVHVYEGLLAKGLVTTDELDAVKAWMVSAECLVA